MNDHNHDQPPRLALPSDRPFRQLLSVSPAQAGKRPIAATDTRACPCCGEVQHAVPIRHYDGKTVIYIWNVCQAMQRSWNATESHIAQRKGDLE